MRVPGRIVLATRNPGKVHEILSICADWPVEWITILDADAGDRARWPHVEETGETYRQNALLKATQVSRAFALPAVADDSGLEVDLLGGEPGPRSARFAGEGASDQQNLRLLIRRVGSALEAVKKGRPQDEPAGALTARYRCVASCVWPGGPLLDVEATCEGRLTLRPRGSGGFGYDPIFVPLGGRRTMAELPPEEKDAISHRGRAFRRLREAIERA